jgi:4-alpha-glucanotransferase
VQYLRLAGSETVMPQALHDLAGLAGVAPGWRDVFGKEHTVDQATLRQIIRALGYAAETDADVAVSLEQARALKRFTPPLVTADVALPVSLPAPPGRYHLVLEDGRSFDGYAQPAQSGCTIPPILEPGYHSLTIDESPITLAVAPRRCCTVRDFLPDGRGYGLAVQLYSLRRRGDGGIGDFAALGEFAASAARHGAHCVAISPVHAQFSADLSRFAPYAPSSRSALNVMHCAADGDAAWMTRTAALEAAPLVDWPASMQARMARFRDMAAAPDQDNGPASDAFRAFRQGAGDLLENHARFEALHGHFFRAAKPIWNWHDWPEGFRDPAGADVARFAAQNQDDVTFHAWLQFLAHHGLADAQRAAREAGMRIGIIADLAVGADAGGSQCWSRQDEVLLGLTIGAPPDLIQTQGQNWGLAAFSPTGLVRHGFRAFIEMLRASLAAAGGVRIDHAMGLYRLWVIPQGEDALHGAYLRYPETDLLRLISLESFRHRAVVIAEDLGTLPEGFQARLRERGIAGMQVLWFERGGDGNFRPPAEWHRDAAALTTTHDLPTVAGWWRGRDLEWRARVMPETTAQETQAERAADREFLWRAMVSSGAASGEAPPPDAPAAAVDAAIAHTARAASDLLIVPVEDILGLAEQPNLPNTIDEHPNWRRRLPGHAGEILDRPEAAARLRAAAARGNPA